MEEIIYRGVAFAGFFIISFIAWITGSKSNPSVYYFFHKITRL
jgi:uncharacterized protein YggT (Ycf19 family)